MALGAGATWLVFQAAGGLADVGDALRQTNPWWLIPAVAFEALAYVLSGVRLRRLAGPDADLTVVSATELELVVKGLGLLTPASPAEGLAFATTELSRRGLARRRIALTLGFTNWFSFRIFYLANAVNLLFMLATRDLAVDATWPLVIAPLVLVLNRPGIRWRLLTLETRMESCQERRHQGSRRRVGTREPRRRRRFGWSASSARSSGPITGRCSGSLRQLGYGVESVRTWVRQADIDDGCDRGDDDAEAERIKAARAREPGAAPRERDPASRRRLSSRRSSTAHRSDGRVTSTSTATSSESSPSARRLQVAPSTYYAAKSRPLSARAVRDAVMIPILVAIWIGELPRLRGAQALEGRAARGS